MGGGGACCEAPVGAEEAAIAGDDSVLGCLARGSWWSGKRHPSWWSDAQAEGTVALGRVGRLHPTLTLDCPMHLTLTTVRFKQWSRDWLRGRDASGGW